jgi:hypothetical protein
MAPSSSAARIVMMAVDAGILVSRAGGDAGRLNVA